MKPCIYNRNQIGNKIAIWTGLLFFLPVIAVLVWFDIVSVLGWISGGELPGMERIFFGVLLQILLGVIAASVVYGWLMLTRTYRFTEQGLYVGGLLRKTRFYGWEQVHDIGVYAYGSNGCLNGFLSGICIFLKPVPTDFAYRAMKAFYLLARLQSGLVVIDDSEPVREELSTVYPGEIKDHRLRQLKLHDYRAYERYRAELE